MSVPKSPGIPLDVLYTLYVSEQMGVETKPEWLRAKGEINTESCFCAINCMNYKSNGWKMFSMQRKLRVHNYILAYRDLDRPLDFNKVVDRISQNLWQRNSSHTFWCLRMFKEWSKTFVRLWSVLCWSVWCAFNVIFSFGYDLTADSGGRLMFLDWTCLTIFFSWGTSLWLINNTHEL